MSRSRPRRSLLPAALLVAIVAVAVPAHGTIAQLTSTQTASGAVRTGDWCAVPDPAVKKNVYRLSDFPSFAAPEPNGRSTSVRMLVLPVVDDGSFDPVSPLPAHIGAAQGQLGMRLWSCSNSMSQTGSIKATAWRGDYASNAFSWITAPTVGRFAEARLNPAGSPVLNGATTQTTNPGAELRDLHRGMDRLGGPVDGADPVTSRYTWLLNSMRSKGADFTADPPCTTSSCTVDPGPGATGYGNVFSADPNAGAANAVEGNSATYLAETYGSHSVETQQICERRRWIFGWGSWDYYGAAPCPSSSLVTQYRTAERTVESNKVTTPARAATLQPSGGEPADALLRDKTGTRIQWVVVEWWGGAPTADMSIEVFVR